MRKFIEKLRPETMYCWRANEMSWPSQPFPTTRDCSPCWRPSWIDLRCTRSRWTTAPGCWQPCWLRRFEAARRRGFLAETWREGGWAQTWKATVKVYSLHLLLLKRMNREAKGKGSDEVKWFASTWFPGEGLSRGGAKLEVEKGDGGKVPEVYSRRRD